MAFSRRRFISLSGVGAGSLLVSAATASGTTARTLEIPNDETELCHTSAFKLAQLIKTRKLSSVEVVTAYLDRIEKINPKINAICTLLDREKCIAMAEEADSAISAGNTQIGRLHGVPLTIKDTVETIGIKTTYGSKLAKNNVPEKDALYVNRLKSAGALIIGKSNVPEFGAGSHTYNDVFGATRNPYDLTKSAGGSTGGGAAAVAAGLIPVTDGSDLGGSLRNPGSFNNLIGFRPSIGRIPEVRTANAWQSVMTVNGVIGRTARDVADHMAIMSGPDPRDPLSLNESGSIFLQSLNEGFKGKKVAWAGDLDLFPFDKEVLDICQKSLSNFVDLGCVVDNAMPKMDGAMDAFQIERGINYAQIGDRVPRLLWWRLKEAVVWNIKYGKQLDNKDILRASKLRSEVYLRVIEFLSKYDYIALPTSQVPPFDVDIDWVRVINGHEMENYLEWMSSCCVFSITGLPSMSVPCGFTKNGLPVGLQIVGGFRKDVELLKLAQAFDSISNLSKVRPDI